MLLELREITKTYLLGEIPVKALNGVSLDIDKGEFIAICGPSGSGKSTLLNIIGTIDTPSTGSVRYAGQDILAMTDDEQTAMRNGTIGFIFQTFNLVPVLSALENVMLPLSFRKMSAVAARDKAMGTLVGVGLEKFVNHRPNKLSGGQRQRVAIARALAQEPALVIADEPTANLDTATSMQILDIMLDLNTKQKITFLFSTHDPRLIDRVKRIMWLQDGVIKSDQRKSAA
ncbi:MAG: ABC transporter ATP-binding protein [Candidatus Schekmanbacteria bacterium]|nr:ABC transporter ATP-binding protein [Candidatus Schekmanbacteria bacterium]